MNFAYVAFDQAAQQCTGMTEAASVAEAREALRKQGLFVTQIHQSTGGTAPGTSASGGGLRLPAGRNRRLRHVTSFTRQLHVLVVSGTPLVQALIALERQAADPQWRDVVHGIRTRVEQGDALSDAMAEYPRYFDPICRSLIVAGESSGKLEPMLERLASLSRKQLHIRTAIRGAMIYPLLLILVSVTVLIVLLTFVLPRFAGMFDSLGTPLPPTTRMVMASSQVLIDYWWALLIGVIAAVIGVRAWKSSDTGRRTCDALVLRLPVFGAIFRNFATARVARLLGVQLEGRVPLLEALRLTRDAAGNTVFAGVVEQAEDAATRGLPISATFAESRLMPPIICEAMRSGEATGQMSTLLLSIADFLDEENEVTVKSLTSILEPMILIVMGVCVGFVAVSMFLPMFDLAGLAAGGGGP